MTTIHPIRESIRGEWESLTRQLLNEENLFPSDSNKGCNAGVFSARLKGVYAKALESHLRIYEQAQKAFATKAKAEAKEAKKREQDESYQERLKDIKSHINQPKGAPRVRGSRKSSSVEPQEESEGSRGEEADE